MIASAKIRPNAANARFNTQGGRWFDVTLLLIERDMYI